MEKPSETEVSEQCQALQREEYDVLESIYPDCIPGEISRGSLMFEVPIELEGMNVVRIQPAEENAHGGTKSIPEEASISTLPPVVLNIVLPPLYPLFKPPELLSVRATHLWLPKIYQLYRLLKDMWQPGEAVLYNWIEFLRTGDFLTAMELRVADNVIELVHPAPRLLASSLRSFDDSTKSTQFANTSFLCSICFTSYKGSKCLQLSCSHIFCRSCLAAYWKLSIAEGEVGKVGCADPECVKAGQEANEDEIARVVSEEEVRRWRWLREKRTFEKDPTMIHCPRAFCQRPVARPTIVGEEEESGWERFRQCEGCSYSFCAFCKRTWHGPHTACPIAHSEKVVLEYLAAEVGSAGRVVLERQYGRANMLKLVRNYEEELANKEWIKASTTACPKCEVSVQKSLGCNHMTCAKCGQHFCYRCGEKLSAGNPYAHFSTRGISCYYKLFDMEEERVEGFDLIQD
ncbi:hypothetical protein AMATHDRAFT_144371 [Amanita thiersii Skay4041]|uniref:RBR-type E3 ubiquitin transferase n=1 Tax=Amanita thiersii Skay4041 TaxID=703135 RepID=A0A2A9NKX6_9AGAR|nr:hypothetical protein AMATHDRAFT_144371 [Amanita thiersii Skay4041]